MENSGSRRQITTPTVQEKPSILEMSQSTYTAKSYRGLGLSGNYQKYTAIVNDFENICKLCQFINAKSTEADYVYVLAVINNLIDMCDAYKREHGYIWPGVVAQRYEKVETIYKCAIGIHDGLIKKGINLQTSPVTNDQSVQPKSELASSSFPQTSLMQQSSVTPDESLEQQERDTQFTQTSQSQIPISDTEVLLQQPSSVTPQEKHERKNEDERIARRKSNKAARNAKQKDAREKLKKQKEAKFARVKEKRKPKDEIKKEKRAAKKEARKAEKSLEKAPENISKSIQQPLPPLFTAQLSPIGSATPGLSSPVPSVQPIPLAMPLQDPFVAQPSIQTSKPKLSREEKRQNARENLIPVCEEERKKYHISADATVSFSDSWKKDLRVSQSRIVDTFSTSGLKKLFGTLCNELVEDCMSRVEECMNRCYTYADINKKLPPVSIITPKITASIDALRDYEDDGYEYYDDANDEDKIISAKDICAIIAFLEKWKEVLEVVKNYFEVAIKSLEPQLKIFADFIDTGAVNGELYKSPQDHFDYDTSISVSECAQLLEKWHIVDAMVLVEDGVVDIKSEKCALLDKCLTFFGAVIKWNNTSMENNHITSVR